MFEGQTEDDCPFCPRELGGYVFSSNDLPPEVKQLAFRAVEFPYSALLLPMRAKHWHRFWLEMCREH